VCVILCVILCVRVRVRACVYEWVGARVCGSFGRKIYLDGND